MSTKVFFDPGKLSSSTLIDHSIHHNHGPISVYLIGDLLGSLDQHGYISSSSAEVKNSLIDLILTSSDISNLSLLDFVGSFSIIVHQHEADNLNIVVSTCCPTPYIVYKGNTCRIIFDENAILSISKNYLSDHSLSAISLSHQLVVRYPTHLFNLQHVVRCPCGHSTLFHLATRKSSYISYLTSCVHSFSTSYLKNALTSILNLYYNSYKSDLGLLFSGGLDSSCLASSLVNQNINLPYFHIDYKGSVSPRSCVASSISNFLGSPTHHIPRFSSHVTHDEVLRQCRAGLMTIPNPMYFGVPINSISCKSLPKYLITGQGADSIYVIDGFAPPTETVGVQRVKAVIDSAKFRLALSESSIRHNFNLGSEYNLSDLISNPKFSDFVSSQCGSFVEHVDYRSNSPHDDSATLDEYNERLANIAEPILELLKIFKPVSTTAFPVSSLYRYIKWMRSLINCPQQDASALNSQGVQRLTPFLEGPIVGIFFSYKIRELESISIKHQLESLFEQHTGVSHRELIERALISDPSTLSCGEKMFEEASLTHIRSVQSQVIASLSSDLSKCGRGNAFISSIKNPTQLVRVGFLL